MRVEVRTELHSTEDVRKVERAMRNIFPDLVIGKEAGYLVGRSNSIKRFSELLREQRIRSAARAVFLSSRSAEGFFFTLNKQVAFIGKISFGSSSPLGDIEVSIRSRDIDSLIDSVAPQIGDTGE